MFCNRCGHKNAEGSKFCSSCGASIEHDDTTVAFGPGEIDMGPEAQVAIEELKPGEAMLVVTRGPNAGSRYLLDEDVTRIGRHPDSTVFFDDITVSRRHSELTVNEAGEFTIRDAGSLNGTYVNKARVEEAKLGNGDEIQIGRFRLAFYTGGERE